VEGSTAIEAAPVVIEARGLHKSFRVPEHRIDTLKERAAHPFRRMDYRELRALVDVSFDIRRGEFFGIAGENGSGKSTLLKILASIYRPDAGRVRMAGRLAPFIELGVGFNQELSARENVVINGVLMGLTKREARRRLDAVLDFAELHDFAELKLKNYSSGMLVRLAFAVMVQADADIMLVDEVLAVGDMGFAQKCMDVFYEKRDAGKTIVLVSHDMGAVQALCHRAMLIHDAEIVYMGEPEEVAMRYYRLNFSEERGGSAGRGPALPDINARVVEARLEDDSGQPVENVAQGAPLFLDLVIEARRDLVDPMFVIQVMNAESVVVFSIRRTLGDGGGELRRGDRVRLAGRIENSLVPGKYFLDCWVRRSREQGDIAVQGLRLREFVVYGTGARDGVVSVSADLEAVPVEGRGT
jgi:ABC-type polysaccharide/polyol phosphate transport system ATPase subunit